MGEVHFSTRHYTKTITQSGGGDSERSVRIKNANGKNMTY